MLRAHSMRCPIREILRCRYCWTKRRVYVSKSHIRLLLLSVLSPFVSTEMSFLKGFTHNILMLSLSASLLRFLIGLKGEFVAQ